MLLLLRATGSSCFYEHRAHTSNARKSLVATLQAQYDVVDCTATVLDALRERPQEVALESAYTNCDSTVSSSAISQLIMQFEKHESLPFHSVL